MFKTDFILHTLISIQHVTKAQNVRWFQVHLSAKKKSKNPTTTLLRIVMENPFSLCHRQEGPL